MSCTVLEGLKQSIDVEPVVRPAVTYEMTDGSVIQLMNNEVDSTYVPELDSDQKNQVKKVTFHGNAISAIGSNSFVGEFLQLQEVVDNDNSVKLVNANSFNNCNARRIKLDGVLSVMNNTFSVYSISSQLSSLQLSSCKYVGDNILRQNYAGIFQCLSSLDLPNVLSVGDGSIQNLFAIEKISLDKCVSYGGIYSCACDNSYASYRINAGVDGRVPLEINIRTDVIPDIGPQTFHQNITYPLYQRDLAVYVKALMYDEFMNTDKSYWDRIKPFIHAHYFITGYEDKYDYTGEDIRPEFIVRADYEDADQLVKDADYTVEYPDDCHSSGVKRCTITGIGKYQSSLNKTVLYMIVQSGRTSFNVTCNYIYEGGTERMGKFSGYVVQINDDPTNITMQKGDVLENVRTLKGGTVTYGGRGGRGGTTVNFNINGMYPYEGPFVQLTDDVIINS